MQRETGRYSTQRYVMGSGTTATQQAFEVVGPADIHTSESPGTILDAHEQRIESNKGLLARMDDKTTTPIKMSAGLASLIGIGIALVSGLLGWAMSYQSVVSRVGDVEKRLEKMDTAIDSLQSLKVTTVTMSNTIETIKKNQDDNACDRKEDSKNIADIRILLAQKGMQ